MPSSREHSTTAITYLYFPARYGFETRNELAHTFAGHIPEEEGLVGVTGAGPARITQYDSIQDALPLVGAATAALIALLVGVDFLSPLPALLVLCAGGLSSPRRHPFARLDQREQRDLDPQRDRAVACGATARDLDRLRDLLPFRPAPPVTGRESRCRGAAVATQFTPTILVAGSPSHAERRLSSSGVLTSCVRSDPGLALSALIGVVVSVTFVPAAIALLGRVLFWPSLARRPKREERAPRRSLRERAAFWSTARPLALLIVLLCVAGLGAAASGLGQLKLGFGLIDGLPPGSETARAADAAGKGFAPGILGPTEILLERHGIGSDRSELSRLEELIGQEPGVAGVLGPREESALNLRGVAVTHSGDAARYAVVFSSDPFEPPAIDNLHSLEDRLPALANEAGLADPRIQVGGATALASDTISALLGDLTRIALVVVLVDFLLLAVFLRALLAPLYLLAASVLALAATLGLTAYVFQDLLGHPGITYYVPFATAVLLVALGSDYNVFVAGRIWQEARERPLREAVATAAPRAARAITVAGLVLAGSFGLLGIVPLRAFAELAFAMGVGVLIDSFIVRSFLVPALVSLFGTAGSWPGRRLRTREELETASA